MEEDEQKLRVRLVGRNGRRRYDPASKDRLVAACHEPGVSVSRLALEHGVNANLPFAPWIQIRRKKGNPRESAMETVGIKRMCGQIMLGPWRCPGVQLLTVSPEQSTRNDELLQHDG